MKLTGLTFTAQYLVNSIDFTRNRFISLLYIYFHYNLRAEKWMVFSFCFKNCSFVRNTNIKILRIKILKSLQGTFAHTSKIYFFPNICANYRQHKNVECMRHSLFNFVTL